MLATEWVFYRKNQAALAAGHPGKEVVIVGETYCGFFDRIWEAFWAAVNALEKGAFLI